MNDLTGCLNAQCKASNVVQSLSGDEVIKVKLSVSTCITNVPQFPSLLVKGKNTGEVECASYIRSSEKVIK